ncbi:MAG TPA: glycolate oxidase subunit GlcF [Thiolapillus brandeum]|uniref:Glycolate oxidase iron-sulfur subunit n=1 Tax=Thiolapillus brandeum TaxID=1076588 RepID=A0A7C5N8A4_9GAMM|nr:glycolate oxidase subunit GlcF [Thiolapillus brandeum]
METRLHPEIAETEEGRIAEEILRSCVHCGFCTATCPTYRLLGDELDGPRGRIYLIKQALESNRAPAGLWLHLERCLLCRACETTCPSGVEYSPLLEIGREFAWHKAPHPPGKRLLRKSLTATLPHPSRLRPLLGLARIARPLLPAPLRRLLPDRKAGSPRPPAQTERRVLLFRGCVQQVVRPGINDAAARLLHRLGIGVEEAEGEQCCGAIHHHLQEKERARTLARVNMERWLPLLEAGAEALLFTASACALEVREYPRLFPAGDPWHAKARKVARRCLELGEFLSGEPLEGLSIDPPGEPVGFHAPCTLQHGLKRAGATEALLGRLGFDLREPEEGYLCCGAAGIYTLLQPELAGRLGRRKAERLEEAGSRRIVTANIGCLLHLEQHGSLPVEHWVELLERCSR